MLLEHRLALELQVQGLGLVHAIAPCGFGDVNGAGDGAVFGSWFDCQPTCPDVTVARVEAALRDQLDGLGLGVPLMAPQHTTVKETYARVMQHQGDFPTGTYKQVLAAMVKKIIDAVMVDKAATAAKPEAIMKQ